MDIADPIVPNSMSKTIQFDGPEEDHEALNRDVSRGIQISSNTENIYYFVKDAVDVQDHTPDKSLSNKQKTSNAENDEENQDHKPLLSEDTTNVGIEESNFEIDINCFADVIEAYKCKYCSFISQDKSSIISHCKESHLIKFIFNKSQMMSTGEKEHIKYICGKCSIPLSSIQACHEHMVQDHRCKTISPINEQNDTKEKDDLFNNSINKYWLVPRTHKEARMKLQANRKIKCTYRHCLYKFNSIDAMITHKSCHTNSISSSKSTYKQSQEKSSFYKCTICQKNFICWPNCSLHFWREHSVSLDLLLCPLCSTLRTHSVSKMIQHIARHWHKNQNENNCGTCTMEAMEVDDNMANLPRWYAKMKCEICQKMFSNSKSLKKHVQVVHKKIKPFTCNICSHSSSSKHTMQLHMRQHTGEKPYSCNLCDYRTGDHNTLRKHRMKHTGERPYKCPYCTYGSIQSIPLKRHLKSRHPDKPEPSCLHQNTKKLSESINAQ